MKNLFGNCNNIIDWNELVRSLKHQSPAYIGPKHEVGDPVPGVDDVVGKLRAAGYKTRPEGGNAGWDMFLPGNNFDQEIVKKIAEFVGLESYNNAWIARILPGQMAPWHWDITDDEASLAKKDIIRYHCHMQPQIDGHMLVVENQSYYGSQMGDVYRWPTRTSWHCAANCGYEPFYSFHIWS